MILTALRQLALNEGLVSAPAFESKGVAWVIQIGREGRFLALVSTLNDPAADSKGRKPRPSPQMMSIPRRIGKTVNIAPDFLVDKSEYVFGVVPEGKAAAKNPEKPQKCRRAFLDLIQTAARETASALLRAVVLFLQSEEQRAACVTALNSHKWASNDLFTFSCDSEWIHSDPQVRRWWAARGQSESDAGDQLRQCLLCGKRCSPVENHDKLKVPGGVTSGVPLVSFNSLAFEKYGLARNENAPICRSCMTAYVEGLRRCLNERYPSPQNSNMMLGQQAVRLSPDTTAVFWTDTPSNLASQLGFIHDRPADLKKALLSPRDGRRGGELEGSFYFMILSGAQGRAMLRSIHREKVGAVEDSIREYFQALEVEGLERDRPLPLYGLLKSLAPLEKLDRLPPKLAEQVFLAAVLRRPIPNVFLNAAVSRTRAEQRVTAARAALLQLYFSRKKQEVPRMSLDPSFSDPGYLFGRLFAVLERVQLLANPGVNSTIVDRFYGAASTRPSTVFSQLLRLNQSHLSKVPLNRNPDWYRKLIGEIMDGLPPQFAPVLDLPQQGLFALGYYHQRQVFFRKASTPQLETESTTTTSKEGAQQ